MQRILTKALAIGAGVAGFSFLALVVFGLAGAAKPLLLGLFAILFGALIVCMGIAIAGIVHIVWESMD